MNRNKLEANVETERIIDELNRRTDKSSTQIHMIMCQNVAIMKLLVLIIKIITKQL